MSGWFDPVDLDALTAPLGTARSLPPSWYLDPAVFEAERDRVFAHGWLPVCHASDVHDPGDFATLTFAGEPIVVVRQRDGSIAAFANVCRHRSMTIMEGVGHAAALQCPYHLWTYRLDGSLASAPDMVASGRVDTSGVCLTQHRVELWHGWVFVNVDPDAPALAHQVPGLTERVADWDLGRMRKVSVVRSAGEWNWKISVENALESYHHRGAHPATLDAAFPGRRSRPVVTEETSWCMLEHESVVDGVEPFTIAAIFPTFMVAYTHPGTVVWLEARPVTWERCEFDLHVYADPHSQAAQDEASMLTEMLGTINDEDIVVNRRTWAGLHSRSARPGPVSHLEAACWQFRRWLAERLVA